MMLCRSLTQFLSDPLICVGIVLITFGIAIGFLSRRIARAIRQSDEVSSSDRAFVAFKCAGMLTMTFGFAIVGLAVFVCFA